MDYHTRIEQLIDELRKLVGWGAKPARLPTLPALRDTLGVKPDVQHKTAGRLMHRALLKAIRSLDGTHNVLGREYPALKLRIALQLLLRYDGTADPEEDNAPTRRAKAMRVLGQSHHVETWRREDGPERYFLAVLAEHLLVQPST